MLFRSIVVNDHEDSLKRVLARGCWSEIITFGTDAGQGFTAEGPADAFNVLKNGQKVGRVEWSLLGRHNQLNALAAIAAAQHVGVSIEGACKALARFENVNRRMELRGEINGIKVYDDFAHHPTAIHTTLEGLRSKVGPQARIIAVFEPRSNTMKLGVMKAQLPASLEHADLAICHSGGLGWDASEALASLGDKALVYDNIDAIIQKLKTIAKPGDHLVCMSNGGFSGIHQKLLDALKN